MNWNIVIFILGGILAVFILVFLFALIQYFIRLNKLKKIARDRTEINHWDLFQKKFPQWPADKLREVYSIFQHLSGIKGFPIFPDDDVDELDLDYGDLWDMVENFIRHSGGSYNQAEAETLEISKIKEFVDWIYKAIYPHGTRSV